MRPHFAKGVEAAFVFIFDQLHRFYRGSQKKLQRWIGRLQVLRKPSIDAWMDTFQSYITDNIELLAPSQAENAAQLQARATATSRSSGCSACAYYSLYC